MLSKPTSTDSHWKQSFVASFISVFPHLSFQFKLHSILAHFKFIHQIPFYPKKNREKVVKYIFLFARYRQCMLNFLNSPIHVDKPCAGHAKHAGNFNHLSTPHTLHQFCIVEYTLFLPGPSPVHTSTPTILAKQSSLRCLCSTCHP